MRGFFYARNERNASEKTIFFFSQKIVVKQLINILQYNNRTNR